MASIINLWNKILNSQPYVTEDFSKDIDANFTAINTELSSKHSFAFTNANLDGNYDLTVNHGLNAQMVMAVLKDGSNNIEVFQQVEWVNTNQVILHFGGSIVGSWSGVIVKLT